jgi:hypothetical protein
MAGVNGATAGATAGAGNAGMSLEEAQSKLTEENRQTEVMTLMSKIEQAQHDRKMAFINGIKGN